MTKFEQAFISAAKAFLAVYASEVTQSAQQPAQFSNDIPICPVHGKAMKKSSPKAIKYAGPLGYKCTYKNDDGSWCTNKA